jgi:phosphatidylinositol glycan class M
MTFGLAVHWRLYPIIFALALLRHLALGSRSNSSSGSGSGSSRSGSGDGGGMLASVPAGVLVPSIASLDWRGLVSLDGFAFGLTGAATFAALGACLYQLYGMPFLHETYLYHASRKDPRHNFSPFFYPAYLADSSLGGVADVGW